MILFHPEMLENSFKDYHVKGFDYVCLRRSSELTLKAYFFDGVGKDLPEVVCPHDHRYAFLTTVLAGSVGNLEYKIHNPGDAGVFDVMQRFSYRTPLNGGNGFTWEREERLRLWRQSVYQRDEKYFLYHDAIHTIKVMPHTILLLRQFNDEPLEHTTTWTRSKEPINLSGLYNRFTADEMIKRIKQINDLMEGQKL